MSAGGRRVDPEAATMRPGGGLASRVSTPTPGDPENAAVRAMFDRIAPRYDLLNHLLSAGIDVRWRRRAVDLLELRSPARVLDLCTGTGDLLIETLRRGPACAGVGIDLSHRMLVRGAAKLLRSGLAGRASMVEGDGQRLPFLEARFDGALVAFGIRNLADRLGALREIRRVLRPGGRLVVLEFSIPSGFLGRLYRVYFGRVLPRLAGVLSERSAYEYLPASVERFPSPAEFAGLMCEAGFGAVRWSRLTGGVACLVWGDKRA